MESIIAAAISAAATLVVCLVTNHASAEKTRAVLDYRLGQLESKVDKHNHLVERMYKAEGRMTEMEHDIRDLKGDK